MSSGASRGQGLSYLIPPPDGSDTREEAEEEARSQFAGTAIYAIVQMAILGGGSQVRAVDAGEGVVVMSRASGKPRRSHNA